MTFLDYLLPNGPTPEDTREPEPLTTFDRWVAYAGLLFLIVAVTYIILRVGEDKEYYRVRHRAVFERCVIETKRFTWCWNHLSPSPDNVKW